MAKQLTVKQERFVQEYCANGHNATKAAISAGYSEATARSQGHRLLTNADISTAIETWRAETAERAHVTVESLTEQLQEIAEDAKGEDQFSAAVSAINSIAKLHGLLAEDRKNERSPLKELLSRIDRENNGKPRLVAVK